MTGRVRQLLWVILFVGVPAAILVPRYLGGDEEAGYTRPEKTLAIGDVVEALYLLDEDDRPRRRAHEPDGRVRVLWFWSSKCKCVSDCEERIRALLARFPDSAMDLLAVDSNPDDTRAEIDALRRQLGSPYDVERDDRGATARYLGITASASVAVIDGTGRLRYRGAIDDDLYDPSVSYVTQAVAALIAGKTVTRTEVDPYGCLYPID